MSSYDLPSEHNSNGLMLAVSSPEWVMVEVEEVTEAPPRLDMEADSERWRICSSMEPVPLVLLWLLRREATSVVVVKNRIKQKVWFHFQAEYLIK